jgi:hypothetical protein
VLALSSIKATVCNQQQADSVLQCPNNHGEHIDSIVLTAPELKSTVALQQLPHNLLQGLTSLKFSKMSLQLQPKDGYQGVLGAGVPLKQLELEDCTFLGGSEESALLLLPKLKRFEAQIPSQPRSHGDWRCPRPGFNQWMLPKQCPTGLAGADVS